MLPRSCSALWLLAVALTVAPPTRGAKWTYAGPDGEAQWAQTYPYCGGSFQSPIDIRAERLRFDPTLRPVEVRSYRLAPGELLTLGNNGHSVQISLPSQMHISSLAQRYTAAQLHFHWGTSGRPTGSEHLLQGRQFPAEMHIVHYNSDKYGNMSAAVDKSDGLAVLGVLMEIGEFHPEFDRFLKFIDGVKYAGQKVQVPGFDVASLLPPSLGEYYRYDGSLTTPPCYPSVLWTVFRQPISISRKQFQTLATALYASHPQDSAPVPLSANFRPPQLADGRVVLVSFKDGPRAAALPAVSPPLARRRVVEQLLVGDLADLADEGLHQLLPGSELLHPGKEKDLKTRSPRKKSPGKVKLAREALSFGALEQKLLLQLGGAHGDKRLAQALRDATFPELNLRSYLEGRSELALPTVRRILRGRPTDEAVELDRSLTRALKGHKPAPAAGKHADVAAKKTLGSAQSHHWLLPMERED